MRPPRDPDPAKNALLKPAWRLAIPATLCVLAGVRADAHPHVFVDGGVDFRIGPGRMLEALEVTWLYDEFETLYMLAAFEMTLNDQGGLNETNRQKLVRLLSDWPEDFDGSAHLSKSGDAIALKWPEGLDAHMMDGRLLMTFTRALETPVALGSVPLEVEFYESTYFFDFTVTNPPRVLGAANGCEVDVIPFDPDNSDGELLDMLAMLGREETSGISNVGAYFADRIVMQCE